MTLESVISEFNLICENVSDEEDRYSEGLEYWYEALLDFLSRNVAARDILGAELVAIVRSFRFARETGTAKLSIDAIAFCMHQLRWPEVLSAAKFEHEDYFSKRRESTVLRLIAAFDDDWVEAEDYRFYGGAAGDISRH